MSLHTIHFILIFFSSIVAAPLLNAQHVHFNDIRLEIELLANPLINTNGDSYIQLDEAAAIKKLDLSMQAIKDLKGIESFVNLESLDCSHNLLSSVDLSANKHLRFVDLSHNQLTHLGWNHEAVIHTLYCAHNQIKELSIDHLNALKKIDCSFNQLKQLDLHRHKQLMAIDCSHNKLRYLNVANGNNQHINAAGFNAAYNQLSCVLVDSCYHSEKSWINRIDAFSFFSHKCSVADRSISSL